ncbi:MAG: sulfurtransferase [Saprospiraceae bacterium]
MNPPIISSKWLANNINKTNIVVLEAITAKNKAAIDQKYGNNHIPNARIFDVKNVFSVLDSKFPNTLPNPAYFEKKCRELGINKTTEIVVYDKLGIFISPRVWWMFKVMGHKNVSILNGGMPSWISEGYTITDILTDNYVCGDFKAKYNGDIYISFDELNRNLSTQESLVIDVRSNDRFLSKVPEPRKGLRSGHIPNSINIPYTELLDNGRLKSKEEINNILENRIPTDKPLIFSCGSGITACIAYLALYQILENKKSVYDGSWTEWAQLSDL